MPNQPTAAQEALRFVRTFNLELGKITIPVTVDNGLPPGTLVVKGQHGTAVLNTFANGTTAAEPVTAAKAAPVALRDDSAGASAGEDDLYQRIYKTVFEQTNDPLKAQLAALGMVKRSRMHLATKSADGRYRIGGWMVLFGSPEVKDRVNTYFDDDTNFELDFYPNAPLWYEHGEDADYGTKPIGRRVNVERFDYGIWGEHELFTDHPLYARTEKELDRGELTYSSDSIQHFVEEGFRERDRRLGYWPLAGCSLVHREAEPGLGGVAFIETETEAEAA